MRCTPMNTRTGPALARGVAWRSPVHADLSRCLDLHPASRGSEILGERRALQTWASPLGRPAFNAAIVEIADAPVSESFVGFGAVVFVTRDFAEAELAAPAPGLNSRVLASVAGGKPVVLDERGLRTNNAGISLDLVVLVSTCRAGLSPNDVSEVRARLTSSFLEIHLGYRFNQLLFEATDAAELALALGISLPAVKKRWLALYDRIGRLEPGLLADAAADADKATRGPQKRHRVLAHLRQHPEELKPW